MKRELNKSTLQRLVLGRCVLRARLSGCPHHRRRPSRQRQAAALLHRAARVDPAARVVPAAMATSTRQLSTEGWAAQEAGGPAPACPPASKSPAPPGCGGINQTDQRIALPANCIALPVCGATNSYQCNGAPESELVHLACSYQCGRVPEAALVHTEKWHSPSSCSSQPKR